MVSVGGTVGEVGLFVCSNLRRDASMLIKNIRQLAIQAEFFYLEGLTVLKSTSNVRLWPDSGTDRQAISGGFGTVIHTDFKARGAVQSINHISVTNCDRRGTPMLPTLQERR